MIVCDDPGRQGLETDRVGGVIDGHRIPLCQQAPDETLGPAVGLGSIWPRDEVADAGCSSMALSVTIPAPLRSAGGEEQALIRRREAPRAPLGR